MKKQFLAILLLGASIVASAQERFSYKENFDANTLEWTEAAHKTSVGTAIINNGLLKVASKGERIGLALLTGNAADIKSATYFETHCYAPIDVVKPFEIHSMITVASSASESMAGILFNYKDDGNFYCFALSKEFITFLRYENGEVVGKIQQAIKVARAKSAKWSIYSDGSTLSFKIDGVTLLNIRYMPLSYSGFGYYTYGEQNMVVDWVEFIQ